MLSIGNAAHQKKGQNPCPYGAHIPHQLETVIWCLLWKTSIHCALTMAQKLTEKNVIKDNALGTNINT